MLLLFKQTLQAIVDASRQRLNDAPVTSFPTLVELFGLQQLLNYMLSGTTLHSDYALLKQMIGGAPGVQAGLIKMSLNCQHVVKITILSAVNPMSLASTMHYYFQSLFFQEGAVCFPEREQLPSEEWMAAKLCAILRCPRQTADVWIDFLVMADDIRLQDDPVLNDPGESDMLFANLVADTLLRLVSSAK